MSAGELVKGLLERVGLGEKAVPRTSAPFPTWTVTKGSAVIAIVEAGEFVAVSSTILRKANRDDAALFHELLSANGGLKGATFGLDKDDSIVLAYTRSIHGLSERVFAFMVSHIASTADAWIQKLGSRQT